MVYFNINNRYILLLLLLFCTTVSLHAQRKAELNITVADDSGAEKTLTAGVDDRATDSLDLKLGEQFIPGHPPATSPIHAALLVENLLSYKSYRRIPNKNKFSLDYTINVNDYSERKTPFFFKWDYPLPLYIDSARIMDPFDGSIYSFPMDEARKSIYITNEGLRNYKLLIWYSLPTVSVSEQPIEIDDIGLEIINVNGKIILKMNTDMYVTLYNTLSGKVWESYSRVNDAEITTSSLSNGIYILVCTKLNGTIISKKINLQR